MQLFSPFESDPEDIKGVQLHIPNNFPLKIPMEVVNNAL